MTHYHGVNRNDDLHMGSLAANKNEDSRTADGRHPSVLNSMRKIIP